MVHRRRRQKIWDNEMIPFWKISIWVITSTRDFSTLYDEVVLFFKGLLCSSFLIWLPEEEFFFGKDNLGWWVWQMPSATFAKWASMENILFRPARVSAIHKFVELQSLQSFYYVLFIFLEVLLRTTIELELYQDKLVLGLSFIKNRVICKMMDLEFHKTT